MNDRSRDVLEDIARVADELGPALVPSGYEELVRSITEAAKQIFEAAACSIALLDDTQRELVYYVASGEGAESVEGMRMPSSQGIAGWVVTSGQPIAIDDVRQDPRFAANVAKNTGYVPTSILAMPLETEREMLGAISVLDRQTSERQETRDMELLALFAKQAALAIENSKVFTSLGRALFTSLGGLADDPQLERSLLRVAEDLPEPEKELAELAASFNTLTHSGPEERRVATRLLSDFVSYIQARRR